VYEIYADYLADRMGMEELATIQAEIVREVEAARVTNG
jgi:hypothetical protein